MSNSQHVDLLRWLHSLTFLCGDMSKSHHGSDLSQWPAWSVKQDHRCSSVYNYRGVKKCLNGQNIGLMSATLQGGVCQDLLTQQKYFVGFYTFHLKQLACTFIGSEVTPFLYQLCSFWAISMHSDQ
jgi:hypothetical protein